MNSMSSGSGDRSLGGGGGKGQQVPSSVVERPSVTLWVATNWGLHFTCPGCTHALHASAIMLFASPCHSHSHRPFLILS